MSDPRSSFTDPTRDLDAAIAEEMETFVDYSGGEQDTLPSPLPLQLEHKPHRDEPESLQLTSRQQQQASSQVVSASIVILTVYLGCHRTKYHVYYLHKMLQSFSQYHRYRLLSMEMLLANHRCVFGLDYKQDVCSPISC
jgi:hypothetical protein